MKILYISNRINPKNKNGAYIVSRRNLENLVSIFGKNSIKVVSFLEAPSLKKSEIGGVTAEIFKKPSSYFEKVYHYFINNRLEGMSIKAELEILKILEKEKFDVIFLDSSSYGYLAEKLKKRFNEIKIISFFHDINKHLYSNLSENGSIKNKILMKSALLNEKKVIDNSDEIIVLNERDNRLLFKYYKREASAIIPVTIKDSLKKIEITDKIKGDYLLFIGVDYLPNVEGIRFFINEVSKKTDIKIKIIGRGMEKYKKEFESLNDKVEVLGMVESLDDYYLNATGVIAPIFLGGGMKVKIAEAMMYGKTIFGTSEAFEGYCIEGEKIGGICNTSKEFIQKINDFDRVKFNKYSRSLFEDKYSYNSSIKIFKELLT